MRQRLPHIELPPSEAPGCSDAASPSPICYNLALPALVPSAGASSHHGLLYHQIPRRDTAPEAAGNLDRQRPAERQRYITPPPAGETAPRARLPHRPPRLPPASLPPLRSRCGRPPHTPVTPPPPHPPTIRTQLTPRLARWAHTDAQNFAPSAAWIKIPRNRVNARREFFYATPSEVRELLAEVAGDLLEFTELPEAAEYHQSVNDKAHSEGLASSTL